MTTIAARAGVMAADTLEIDNNEELDAAFKISARSKKIFRLPDGRLFGGAGSSEDILRLYDALRKKQPAPKLEHVSGLLMNLNGKLELYEGNIWQKVHEPYYAIGTGAGFAFAAMHAKADAVLAAKIGAMMDPFSGGRVLSLCVRKRR